MPSRSFSNALNCLALISSQGIVGPFSRFVSAPYRYPIGGWDHGRRPRG
jgi:hypothetical protein